MVRHLVCSLCFAAFAAPLALQECGTSLSRCVDRPPHLPAGRVAVADPPAGLELPRGRPSREGLPLASALLEQFGTEDPPPWLAELLHAPDPNARIQGLDAWARLPSVRLSTPSPTRSSTRTNRCARGHKICGSKNWRDDE